PQLVDAVAAGKVAVSAAARIAALPAEQQQAVVRRIESGLKPSEALGEVQGTLATDGTAWVDDDGHPLPENIIPAFRERDRFDNLCRRIDAVVRDVERLASSPAAVHFDVQEVSGPLKRVRQALWTAQP